MKRSIEDLTKLEFENLKESGLLWEIFPEAPEFWHEIRCTSSESSLGDAFAGHAFRAQKSEKAKDYRNILTDWINSLIIKAKNKNL